MEFLFDQPFEIAEVELLSKDFDVFEQDPTVSLMAKWGAVNVEVLGQPVDMAPVFNVYLTFEQGHIDFIDSGKTIKISLDNSSSEQEVLEDCTKDYMKYVVEYVLNANVKSNLNSSIDLNSRMLKIIAE